MKEIRGQESEVVRIEPANWLDFVALNKLSRICFEKDAWPWIDMLAALVAPRAVPLKAVVGESNVIAYVIGDRRRPDLGWIASIAVHPEWRGKGIGSRLMQEVEARLGTPVIRLTLRESNEAALRLYRKRGYRQVKIWPAYYRDGEHGLVMERVIGKDSF